MIRGMRAPANPLRRLAAALEGRPAARHALLAIGVLLVTAAVQPRAVFPRFDDIGTYDEALYVGQGRMTAQTGALPRIAWAPFVALVYAPVTALAPAASPEWMTWSVRVVRVLFGFLFAFFVIRAVAAPGLGIPAWQAAVFLVVLPIMPRLLANSSDLIYAAMLSASLFAALRWLEAPRPRRAFAAGIAIAFGALTRVDGFVLLACAAAAMLVLAARGERLRHAAAVALPLFVLVPAAHLVTSWQREWRFDAQVSLRSYVAFRQGEYAAWPGRYATLYDAEQAADARFGTFDENRSSVPRALLRHPGAAWEHMSRIAAVNLPAMIMEGYGPQAVPLGLAAAAGAIFLWRGRRRRLLLLLACWTLPVTVYVMTFFRSGYLLHATAVYAMLGLYGFREASGSAYRGTARAVLTAAAVAAAAAGALLIGRAVLPAIVLPAVFVIRTAAIRAAAIRPSRPPALIRAAALLAAVLLCAPLVVKGVETRDAAARSPGTPLLDLANTLQRTFSPGDTISSFMPMPIFAAGLSYLEGPYFADSTSLTAWCAVHEPRIVLVDTTAMRFPCVHATAGGSPVYALRFRSGPYHVYERRAK